MGTAQLVSCSSAKKAFRERSSWSSALPLHSPACLGAPEGEGSELSSLPCQPMKVTEGLVWGSSPHLLGSSNHNTRELTFLRAPSVKGKVTDIMEVRIFGRSYSTAPQDCPAEEGPISP